MVLNRPANVSSPLRNEETRKANPGLSLTSAWRSYHAFLFESIDPRRTAIFRLAYSVLMLLMVLPWLPFVGDYFSDASRFPLTASRQCYDEDTFTIFQLLPNTPTVAYTCYAFLLAHIVFLGVGFFSRFQAAAIFFWLCSFQHRNPLIWDGEDTVFRLFAFFLALTPCGCAWSLDALFHRREKGVSPALSPRKAWAFRLIQIETTLIYLSTALCKLNGTAWLDGTALYYVSRLDDLFGKFYFPDWLLFNLSAIRLMTWSVVAAELFIPIGVWFKETRRAAILTALVLHLGIEWTMHLNFFEWIMALGVLSFADSSDVLLVRQQLRRWGQAFGGAWNGGHLRQQDDLAG